MNAEIATLFDRAIKGMAPDSPPGAIPALYRLKQMAEEAIELLEMAHGTCDLHYDYAACRGMWTGDESVDNKDFADVVGEFLGCSNAASSYGEKGSQ